MSGAADRSVLVHRGLLLSYATLGYNSLEGLVAIVAGLAAGSIALVGFGVDSVIELSASLAAIWRLKSDLEPARRARAEHRTRRIVGWLFLALAAYVAWDAISSLVGGQRPSESLVGIALAALSLIVMPLLVRAKRSVARELGSSALYAEASQTLMCMWLSAILLAGLLLNATLGWWWADPVAGLAMVPLIVREGVEGLQGRECC
jgi:divalent metal cation (Fe/Co/Zn/Cd) transporter